MGVEAGDGMLLQLFAGRALRPHLAAPVRLANRPLLEAILWQRILSFLRGRISVILGVWVVPGALTTL